MSNADSDRAPDRQSPSELLEYRAVSGLAIAALLLGLLSAMAEASLVLWGVPLIAAITSIVALVRIDRSGGALAGRAAALCGLVLSVFFGAAAPAHYVSTERLLSDRAEQVGRQWFAALAHDEPQVAHQLGLSAAARARTSNPGQLWNYYRNAADRRRDLERFVAEPLIRALLALDGNATARLYDTRESRSPISKRSSRKPTP